MWVITNIHVRCFVLVSSNPDKECRDRVRLICASDGVTYTNKCEMRWAACRGNLRLSVVHEGMCARKLT